jgi:hypothetical protein
VDVWCVAPLTRDARADASVLAGEDVDNEDDVLYMPKMPELDERITPVRALLCACVCVERCRTARDPAQRDVELLLQFLTAPYLRIPLVLHFFADEGRMHALANRDVQDVIDATLFEP